MDIIKTLSKKQTVLYADDDDDDLELVQDAFASYTSNVEVITAADGKQALSYLESLGQFEPVPCLIILDINMPRMNGKEALKAIRNIKRFEDVPIVLFTNSSLLHDKNFAQQYNAGFITKPVVAKEMQIIAAQFVEYCSDDVKKQIQKKVNTQ